jgi:putative peptide zinc metalloprotease protein
VNDGSQHPPTWVLRPGLTASLRSDRGIPYYIVEDQARGEFFRLGKAEWEFLRLMDGSRDLDAVARDFIGTHPDEVLDKQRIERMVLSAMQHGLLQVPNSSETRAAQETPSTWLVDLQKLAFLRLSIGSPDRHIRKIEPYLRWIFGPVGFLLWMGIVIIGGLVVWQGRSQWANTIHTYVTPQSWIMLWGAWLFLKVVHELGHAVSCIRFGGRVGLFGITLVLFVPIAYVDVTTAWRFRSKWARIITSAAGMYLEFAVAGLAAICWQNTDSDLVRHICHSLMVSATVSTLLFNANPLAKFDGYYILSDLWEVPNLGGAGRLAMANVLRKLFLGKGMSEAPGSMHLSLPILIYGTCAGIWRMVIMLTLTVGAAYLFGGIGILVAISILLGAVFIPLFRGWMWLRSVATSEERRRCAHRVGMIVAICAAVSFLPWPFGIHLPGIVDYSPLTVVRAESEGFVDSVLCHTQSEVKAGDELIRLRNHELEAEAIKLQKLIAQTKVSQRIATESGNWSQQQRETSRLAALEERRIVLTQQLESLVVRATSDGMILTPSTSRLLGTFVHPGQTLFMIGDPKEKVVISYVSEKFLTSIRAFVKHAVSLRTSGEILRPYQGTIDRIDPVCTTVLEHPGLGAHLGGPLPVVASRMPEAEHTPELQYELTYPRHHAVIRLDPSETAELTAGELATITLVSPHETVFSHLYRGFSTYIQRLIGRRSS